MPSISPPSEGRLYDGESARAHRVSAWREGDLFAWTGPEGEQTAPVSLLAFERRGGRVTLHRADRPDWRLIFPTDAHPPIDGVRGLHRATRRQLGWGTAILAGLALVGGSMWAFGNRALVWAAPFVPHDLARSAGQPLAALMLDDGGCTARGGQEALDRLVARLMPADPAEPIRVRVARSDTANAFTLPGGDIILLRGIIDEAESADEVAGVLAHELGHVQKRHANQALIRHFGFDVFLQGIGGNLGSVASTGLFLRHSRGAEHEADAEALGLLRQARISPMGLARFFERLNRTEPGSGDRLDRLAELTETHPADADRIRRFRSAAPYATTPALSPGEWRAFRAICRR